MKTTNLIYLNDTASQQILFKENLFGFVKKLEPGQAFELEISHSEDQGIFVKVWEGKVLIGRTDLKRKNDKDNQG